eukprot:1074381-Amphidinium_carterae.1
MNSERCSGHCHQFVQRGASSDIVAPCKHNPHSRKGLVQKFRWPKLEMNMAVRPGSRGRRSRAREGTPVALCAVH